MRGHDPYQQNFRGRNAAKRRRRAEAGRLKGMQGALVDCRGGMGMSGTTIAPDGEMFGPINVIEVRACKNGHVVTVFYEQLYSDRRPTRGYESLVVERHDPDKIGAAVAGVLREKALTPNVLIEPVRKLP